MCTASAVFACSRVRTAPWLSRGASWHRRATAPQLLLVREARAQAAGGKLPPAAQRHTPGLRRASDRSATPIISSSISEVQFFGDEGENAQDFEAWVQNMQGEQAESDQLAAPVFASFFGGGDPPDEAELTEAIRDEIARASAVAAEAAVSAATPAPSTQPIVLMTPNPALTPSFNCLCGSESWSCQEIGLDAPSRRGTYSGV